MLNTTTFPYLEEFFEDLIEDLIYFNEEYGDTFECDGDNLKVMATYDRRIDKCHL